MVPSCTTVAEPLALVPTGSDMTPFPAVNGGAQRAAHAAGTGDGVVVADIADGQNVADDAVAVAVDGVGVGRDVIRRPSGPAARRPGWRQSRRSRCWALKFSASMSSSPVVGVGGLAVEPDHGACPCWRQRRPQPPGLPRRGLLPRPPRRSRRGRWTRRCSPKRGRRRRPGSAPWRPATVNATAFLMVVFSFCVKRFARGPRLRAARLCLYDTEKRR